MIQSKAKKAIYLEKHNNQSVSIEEKPEETH